MCAGLGAVLPTRAPSCSSCCVGMSGVGPFPVPQTKLFRKEDIPWDLLAFATGKAALNHFFTCKETGVFVPLQRTFRSAPRAVKC
jgi:hypothetical protein